jgi:thiosulfate/3-mercaptopyruvate sulfurtransferase
MAATFGRLGIDAGTQVAVYDQDAGPYASRLWWMLRYMGHDAVAVVDGGWATWVREGRPVRSREEQRPPVAFTPHLRQDMRISIDEVERRLGDPGLFCVDARSPERFEGQLDPLDNVPGHIPGARNHFYRNNLSEDGTMRPSDALRADFTALLGDRSADQLVMYCGSGVTACHNLLAMEHVGLHGARLFAGSWSEWEADPQKPIEKS